MTAFATKKKKIVRTIRFNKLTTIRTMNSLSSLEIR